MEIEVNNSAKTVFFSHLGFRVRESFRLHKVQGRLWERIEGEKPWRNISEHCLVEVARAEVFAEWLQLPQSIAQDLVLAVAVHDYNKRNDIESDSVSSLTALDEEGDRVEQQLRAAGFSDLLVRMVRGLEDTRLPEVERIVSQDKPSFEDTACLVMHYLDDYTRNTEWVVPATQTTDGRMVNDLDRRMDGLESNLKYAAINEEGRRIWGNETAFQAQRRIGHMVEDRLARIISERSGRQIDPPMLPQLVDEEIKLKISRIK